MEKGELWIVKFPSRRGREQEGIRPGIVMADTDTDLILVIPMTSNLEALERLPHTRKIKKSDSNGLNKDSVALVFQLQVLDKKRFMSKIGNLEEFYIKEINQMLRDLLKL